MLSFDRVSFGRGRALIRELSFGLRAGEILAVMGPNGCGKSTMLAIFAERSLLLGGMVSLGGRSIGDMSQREIFSLLALASQNGIPACPCTVEDYVLAGWYPRLGLMGVPGRRERDDCRRVMEQIGILQWASRRADALSGGEFKLVQLARAMTCGRRLLLLDELDSSLDFANRIRIATLLRRFAAGGGAVLMITHSPEQARDTADRILLLSPELPPLEGSPEEALASEILGRYFGVRIPGAPDPGALSGTPGRL